MIELTTQQRHILAHLDNGGACPWQPDCKVSPRADDYMRWRILKIRGERCRLEQKLETLQVEEAELQDVLWVSEHPAAPVRDRREVKP